jgi:glycosyltransferase involved in cell wall biosynthesis
MRRAAIVHVMGWRSQQYGSFERFMVELCRRCAQRGLESHLVFQAEPRSAEFVADSGASVHVLPPAFGPFDPRYMLRLARVLRRVRPSHLHAHHGVDLYNALALARALQVPHRFATKHSTPGDSRLTLARARHRWIARQVQTYFTVSRWVEGNLRAAGVAEEKLRVCYLGIDPERYRPDPSARAEVRRELGLAEDRRILLSTSHLRPGKGVELLPQLAADLREEPGAATLLAAGDGPLRDALAARARALGLGEQELRLLGVRVDVPRLLAAADVFVFPTTAREGMPLGALEALAAGVPLVATRVSDLGALLGDVALLVEPQDEPALLAACRRLLGEPELAARLSEAGRRLARERLSVREAADSYASVYLGALSPESGGDR